LILYYLQTSDTIKAIEARHKQELAKSKKFLEKLSYLLLEALDNSGQDSAKTKKGTVSAIVRDTASLSDASKFMDFVRDNDAYELMDRRANGTACKEYAREHGVLPPGVRINSIRLVSVRNPTSKNELVIGDFRGRTNSSR